jgi:ubiquinone biosynthesis protein
MREMTLLDRIRERRRLEQIYNVFVHYGVDFLFDRGIVGVFRRRMQQLLHRPPYRLVQLPAPVKIRMMLQDLGPTYVKMGQIVSSQSTVLPTDWTREMARLQSDVRPFSFEQVREVITDELGAPPEEIFETFDPKPLAAASIAQVHRASLEDDRVVAVKIQRPDIEMQLRADVDILRRGGGILERRTIWARQVGLAGVLDEFGSNLIRELDYSAEAFNARRLARNLASIEGVHIPEVERRLSARRVMTMEYIDGVKVSDVDQILAAGLDPEQLVERALRAAIKMLLVDGFFHADPHPGNVLVQLDTGRLVFLDAGMVGELSLRQRAFMINLLYVASTQDSLGLAQTLRTLSEPFRAVSERGFYKDFERRVGRYLDPQEQARFADTMTVALDVLRDNGLRLDPQLTLALKALTQAEAFTTVLYRVGRAGERDEGIAAFVTPAVKIVEELVTQSVTSGSIEGAFKRQLAFAGREIAARLPSMQDAAGKWLDQLKGGQFTIKLDTSDLSTQVRQARSVARLVTLGVVLSGMIIGSGIAATIGEAQGTFSFVTEFARVFFVGGTLLAGILVVLTVFRLSRERRSARE